MGLAFTGVAHFAPRLRPALWRWWYNELAAKDTSGQLALMNYGYAADDATSLTLDSQDEPFRYPLQLYAHVVNGIELRGKDVVEVGCGRGGGASFLIRYRKPRSFTGVDLSESAIEWCKRYCNTPGARWLQGRADRLPVQDASMDVAVNVESSHCYPSMADFVKEVVRVLRSGGYFAFCDLRPPGKVEELERSFGAVGLKTIERHEITPHVIRALDHVSNQREAQIVSYVPKLLRGVFRDFVGMKGTVVHEMLARRQLVYMHYVLQKRPG